MIGIYIVSIRLAALLHDLGHCLFSHCSERVIDKCPGTETYPSAKSIQETISKHFRSKKLLPFAEIFTLSLIGSKRFSDFINDLNFSNKKEIEKDLKNCCCFIIGQPVEKDPSSVFLAQLISSGLDADKIDYMLREQHYSGIKLEIDIDRILSKLRVFNLKSYELPNHLHFLKDLYQTDSNLKVLGFEKGGQFAFEEFCVARLALHVKIYLHQKVRAAEAQLSKYLETLAETPVLKQVHSWIKVPETIIEFPEIANQRFATDGTLFNVFELNSKILDQFRKIDQRDIVHRAFAFGPINSYSEGNIGEDGNLSEKFESYFDPFRSKDLKEKIIQEAITICDENDISIKTNLLDDIIIEIPRLLNIQQGQESLYFERASYLPVRWTIPIDKIIIYFQENRALAYIFCPKEIASVITIASEKIIFEISKKVYSQEGHLSKATYSEFQFLKNQLKEKNWYNKYPQLKPISEYLKKAAASEKINTIHEKLKGFKSFKDDYITINRITTFVNQFPEGLQDVCLCFLEQLEIYSENLLGDEIQTILDKIAINGTTLGISPLGSAADSGNRLNYYLRPIFEKYKIETLELNDSMVLDNDKLVLYDDNINSGLQLVNIFAELLGMKDKLPKELWLNENHHRKLVSEKAKEKFLRMPIYIVYIIGFDFIEDKIRDMLEKYLGFNPGNINIRCRKRLSLNTKILTGSESAFNHADKKELKDFLMQVGENLLKEEGKIDEKIQSCKLGYAQAEAMVMFPYNIPTMTITALWCRGEVNCVPWIPLAERRRRIKDGKYLGED